MFVPNDWVYWCYVLNKNTYLSKRYISKPKLQVVV